MYSVVMFYYEHNQKKIYIYMIRNLIIIYYTCFQSVLYYRTDMYNICFVYTLQICMHDKHLIHKTISEV